MSAPMTIDEFTDLAKHIYQHHSPVSKAIVDGKRVVKYIDPHIDLRDGMVFSVSLRGYGWEQNFSVVNEGRDIPESLDTRIRNWLNDDLSNRTQAS